MNCWKLRNEIHNRSTASSAVVACQCRAIPREGFSTIAAHPSGFLLCNGPSYLIYPVLD